MAEPLAVDRTGHELLEFVRGRESDLAEHAGDIRLPLSLMIARHRDETLLVLDRRRREWELPGGMIDAAESPRDAAAREFREETGQTASQIDYVGLALFRLMPDRRLEHAAVFRTAIARRTPFVANDEIEDVLWWDGTVIPDLSALDARIARLGSP